MNEPPLTWKVIAVAVWASALAGWVVTHAVIAAHRHMRGTGWGSSRT